MKNSESTICKAVGASTNYQKVENYIYEVQNAEKERFHKDFKQLPRKIQFFIIRLVKEYNRLRVENDQEFKNLSIIMSWIDAYGILNYSEHKIIFHITDLYLKGCN
jgi:hypothetical protein